MAVDERAAGLKKASEDLVRVTEQLQQFNERTGVEIAKVVGKDLKKVTDPFVGSIMQIPGVAMLGDVGKTLGNKIFVKMKEKREMEHLRGLINQRMKGEELTKEQFDHLRFANDVTLAQQEQNRQFEDAVQKILGIESNDAQFKELADGIRQSNENEQKLIDRERNQLSASELEEIENNKLRREERRDTLFGSIANGIEDMSESIMNGLSGLKDKGLVGLLGSFGIAAGIFAAPFIAISSFFTQLAMEVKVLDTILKGGLSRFFQPITRFFTAIGDIFGKAGTGQFLKGDTLKIFGRYADDISRFIGSIKNLMQPIIDGIGKVMNLAKGSTSFMAGFGKVATFASTVGRTLGKIFLPITILMSVFDGVTGFIRGFKEDGILGGIKEAVIGVVDGFVGGLIRMVTSAFAFLLELIGLDNFAASLKENVGDAIEGVYEIFRGVVDIITFPFKLVFEAVKGIFGGETDFGGLFAGLGESIMGIFDGVINIITAPFDMIFGLIKDVFSFFGFELPDFDIGETILGFISDAYDFVKGKVKGFFSFLGFGGDDLEEEVSEARDAQNELARTGAVSADGRVRSTVRRNGVLDVQASEARLAAMGYQVATPEQRAALEEAAAARTAAAEQALEDFRNAPKLSDAIGNVTEKMGEVFNNVKASVSEGFTAATTFASENFPKVTESLSAGVESATAFAKGLFTFTEEDASVAGIATKMIDIILAPYNLAVNFLSGIFGFGADEEGIVPPFSIGEMIVGVVTDIFDFFKGLFDIDIKGLISSIPGAGKILDFFGFGDDEDVEKLAKPDYNAMIASAEAERARLQEAIDEGRFATVGISDRDERRRVAELEEQIAELSRLEAEQERAVTVVNNNNVVNANTTSSSSTVTTVPIKDQTPPAGTVPVM